MAEKEQGLFTLTFETRQLVDQGKEIKDGDLWSYAAMNKLLGFDITQRRGLLNSARRVLQREYGMLFEPVIGSGIRQLTNDDKPKFGSAAIHSIGKKVLRIRKALATIDVGNLPPSAKVGLFTTVTILHVIEKSTAHKTITRVQTAIGNSGMVLPIGKTIELFEEK